MPRFDSTGRQIARSMSLARRVPPSVGRAQQSRADGESARHALLPCALAVGAASLQGDRPTAEPFPTRPKAHVDAVASPRRREGRVRAAPGFLVLGEPELSVGQFTLLAMRRGVGIADVVEAITRASVESADEGLRVGGWCPPPTAHMLSCHLASPYIGSVTTRPFYRGADAAAAVAALGRLPSLLCATQLVVVWEYADLCVALELPNADRAPNALVVVDADLDGHLLGWHPFEFRTGPISPQGLPTATPEWSEPASYSGTPLPAPMAELLAVWRKWLPGDIQTEARALEATGFRMAWAHRP